MRRRSILYAAVCLCVFAIVVYAVALKPKIATAGQAVARAREFCTQIGWKTQGSPVVEKSPIGCPRGAWSVEFRDEADETTYSLDVGGPQGSVLGAYDRAARDRLVKPVPTRITRDRANKLAERLLHAAGAGMRECRMDYSRIDKPLDKDSPTTWEVRYSRFYKGYEFEHDGAYVQLDPGDASLVGMAYYCNSELPRTTHVSIKKEAAIRTATDFLKPKRNIDRVKFAKLLISQPSFPEDFEIDGPEPTKSYLCWYVYFIWDQGHEAFLYVDAATGTVRGWDSCM